jgi:hypothetical protein
MTRPGPTAACRASLDLQPKLSPDPPHGGHGVRDRTFQPWQILHLQCLAGGFTLRFACELIFHLFFGLVLPINRHDGFVAVRHRVSALVSIGVASARRRSAAAALVRSHSCRIGGAFRTRRTCSRPRSSRASWTALSKRQRTGYQESDYHCDGGEFHCRTSFEKPDRCKTAKTRLCSNFLHTQAGAHVLFSQSPRGVAEPWPDCRICLWC